MKRRGLSLLLVLTLLLSLFAGSFSFAAENSCGDNLTWSYDEDACTLTISGSGAMWDYAASGENLPPWLDYCRDIEVLVLEEGVTTIGAYAFIGCRNLYSVSLPSTLTTIGAKAFRDSDELEFDIPDSVTVLTPNYAVILASAQEDVDASVTLAFPDGTSDTYTVHTYQDEDEVLHTENFAALFAENALVGDIVSVTFGAQDTVDLITEAAFCEGSTKIKDTGMVYNGSQYWALDSTPLFLLYTDGEDAPIGFKMCSMAWSPDFDAAAIPVTASKDLIGCTVLPTSPSSHDAEIAVITYGTTEPTVTVAPDKVGYVVSSEIKRVGGTPALSLSVIDAEHGTLVSGIHPYAPEELLALPIGTKLTEDDEFAVGTVVGFAHNGETFDALTTYASASALDVPFDGYDGYYKVTVFNADDGRIGFYPYETTESTVLTTSRTYASVGIANNRPAGSAVERIPSGTVPQTGEYNAIIEVKSEKVNAIWSLYDLMDGSTESARPEVTEDYAVVLRSFYHADEGTAEVKLAFADNTAEIVTVTGFSDGETELPLSVLDSNNAVGSLVTVARADDGVTLTLAAPFVQGYSALNATALHAADRSKQFAASNAPLFLIYVPNDTSKIVGAVAYCLDDLANRSAAVIPVWTQPDQREAFRGSAVVSSSEPGYFSAAVMTFGVGVPGPLPNPIRTGYVLESSVEQIPFFNQSAVRVTLIDAVSGEQLGGLYYDVAEADLEAFRPGSIVNFRHDGAEFTKLEHSQYGTLAAQETKLDTSAPAYGYYKVTATAHSDSSLSCIAYGDTEVQTLPILPTCSTLAISGGVAIGNAVELLSEPPESGFNALIEVQHNGKISKIISFPRSPLSTVNGAQIRTSGTQGLRFVSSIDKTNPTFSRVVEYGTLLIPSEDLSQPSELQIGATLNGHEVAKVPAQYLYKETDDTATFTAVIINIKERYYTREYTARAYAILEDGSVIYGDTVSSRSVCAVAERGLQNPNETEANKALFREILSKANNA